MIVSTGSENSSVSFQVATSSEARAFIIPYFAPLLKLPKNLTAPKMVVLSGKSDRSPFSGTE